MAKDIFYQCFIKFSHFQFKPNGIDDPPLLRESLTGSPLSMGVHKRNILVPISIFQPRIFVLISNTTFIAFWH